MGGGRGVGGGRGGSGDFSYGGRGPPDPEAALHSISTDISRTFQVVMGEQNDEIVKLEGLLVQERRAVAVLEKVLEDKTREAESATDDRSTPPLPSPSTTARTLFDAVADAEKNPNGSEATLTASGGMTLIKMPHGAEGEEVELAALSRSTMISHLKTLSASRQMVKSVEAELTAARSATAAAEARNKELERMLDAGRTVHLKGRPLETPDQERADRLTTSEGGKPARQQTNSGDDASGEGDDGGWYDANDAKVGGSGSGGGSCGEREWRGGDTIGDPVGDENVRLGVQVGQVLLSQHEKRRQTV